MAWKSISRTTYVITYVASSESWALNFRDVVSVSTSRSRDLFSWCLGLEKLWGGLSLVSLVKVKRVGLVPWGLVLHTCLTQPVLWLCWFGIRNSIRPVKNWVMGYWHGYVSGVWYKWFAYGPADATATPSSLASVKSRMVYLSDAGLPRLSWKKGR